MKVVYPSAKEFASLISVLSNAVDEALFEFKEDGFQVRALDPSRVMFIKVTIPPDSFEEYNTNNEEIGVNLQFLSKVLKRAKKKDKIIFEFNDNMLKITLEGGSRRTFKTGVIDVQSEDIDLPELEYTAHAIVDGKELFEAIKDVSLVSDAVRISVENEELKISGSGSTSDVNITIDTAVEGEDVKSSYGISYLMDIMKSLKNGEVTLHFGENMPIQIEYENGGGKTIVLLAPRVEE